LSLFSATDGSFVRYLRMGLDDPVDVEEVEGGVWAVAAWSSHTVEFVSESFRGRLGSGRANGDLCCPSAVAFVPGLGLFVRAHGGEGMLQLFATPDTIAMAAMCVIRTTWMAAVVRSFVPNA
jgi:hypothetical protein